MQPIAKNSPRKAVVSALTHSGAIQLKSAHGSDYPQSLSMSSIFFFPGFPSRLLGKRLKSDLDLACTSSAPERSLNAA